MPLILMATTFRDTSLSCASLRLILLRQPLLRSRNITAVKILRRHQIFTAIFANIAVCFSVIVAATLSRYGGRRISSADGR